MSLAKVDNGLFFISYCLLFYELLPLHVKNNNAFLTTLQIPLFRLECLISF